MAVCLTLLQVSPAAAHQRSVASLELRLSGRQVQLSLRGTPADLAPLLEVQAAVRPLPELYRAKREVVLRHAASFLTLRLQGGPLCSPRTRRLERAEAEVIELRLVYECPRHPDALELRYDLLFDDDPLHRGFLSAPAEPGQPRAVLTSAARTFSLQRPVSLWQHARAYLGLGIEHIFTGYDHLCFLAGLLLAAAAGAAASRQRLLRLLGIVSAFTLAHSLTLIAAALDLLRLPARLVEPAIAISILYVGIENLFSQEPRRRWLLAFAFGLVHGFGFAHLLREIGLPHRGMLLSLFAFNGGVELGQLAVAGLLFPVLGLLRRERPGLREGLLALVLLGLLLLLLWSAGVPLLWPALLAAPLLLLGLLGARRFGYRRAILQGGSGLIALLGLIWTVQRVAGW